MPSQIVKYVQWVHATNNLQPNTALDFIGTLGTSTFTRASEIWPYVVPAKHFLALQRIYLMSKGGSTGRNSMFVLSAVGVGLDNMPLVYDPPFLVEPGRIVNATIINNEEFPQNMIGSVTGFLIATDRNYTAYGQILIDIGWHQR